MKDILLEFENFKQRLTDGEINPESYEVSLGRKYKEISAEARKISESGRLRYRSVRSWSLQDDMGVPIQLRRFGKIDEFLLENALRLSRQILPTRRKHNYFQKQNLNDDFEILRKMNFLDILQSFPVDETPFVRDIYKRKGFSFNSRYLRYVYLAGRIRDEKLLQMEIPQVYVDIGNFYGGLQGLLKNIYPQTTFISVELQHQLFRSFVYHTEMFPTSKRVVGGKEFLEYLRAGNRSPAFVYLLPTQFSRLSTEIEIDLLSNFLSFGEMSRINFETYYRSASLKLAKKIYLVNRFISSPWFDQTFSDRIDLNDYFLPNFNVEYLDVFPIHHYSITHRSVDKRYGFRNASSSQFELIMSRVS